MGLFVPDYYFDTVYSVTPELLKERNVKGIILDIDNTLVPYEIPEPTEEVRAWLGSMWWLSTVDGVLIIGDLVYGAGFILLGVIAVAVSQDADESNTENKNVKKKKGNDRLYGEPDDINVDGYSETHIGSDGRADRERHHTNHGKPKEHTNPHDHEIKWDGDNPSFGRHINYPSGNVPIFK